MGEMIPAYGYLRVSGKGQLDGDGLERQRDSIERFAAANGYQIVEWFTDGGVTGTRELEYRPALAALLASIEGGAVRVVLVERSDRLARDLIVSELIYEQFRRSGARVIEAESGTELSKGDSADPTSKLIRQILAAVAEFDKDVLVLKLRAARDRMRRTAGRCEGPAPYGSRPGEEAALVAMRRLRSAGLAYRAIAERLNGESLLTRGGGSWRASTVHGILTRKA